jgi:hypothetical protein
MCDFCGCPLVEPFATLTAEHGVMLDLAEGVLRGDPIAFEDLRGLWDEHASRERAALSPLGSVLGLPDVVEAREPDDRALDTMLALPPHDARAIRGAAWDHVDAWEFEVFPHLMMAATEDELEAADARGTEGARGAFTAEVS